jgi:hypothetical protein
VTISVLAIFAVDTIQTAPETFTSIIALGVLSVVLDALVRRGRHRRPQGRAGERDSGGRATQGSASAPEHNPEHGDPAPTLQAVGGRR